METKNIKDIILYKGLIVAACLALSITAWAQSPSPSPSSAAESTPMIGGYELTSSIEFGVRGIHVNGDHEKYRSDLNYQPGFRIFDSSFLLENKNGGERRPFDTAFVSATGWGSDPSSSFRMKIDRTGIYKFESSVRRVRYFNNLKSHAPIYTDRVFSGSQHRFNILHHFGDFDLTIFPERDFRFKVGYSFNNSQGPGFWSLRWPFANPGSGANSVGSDEFTVNDQVKTKSQDIRFGVEGKVLGFNLGFNYGHRWFRDNTRLFVDTTNFGNNPIAGNTLITNGFRLYPVRGSTDYFNFFIQRTFARKLDFTGRLVYAETNSRTDERDFFTGRPSTTGIIVTGDTLNFPGRAKRPQTRADLGITWRITDDFRLSNTFTFDQFNITGGMTYTDIDQRTTSTGTLITPDFFQGAVYSMDTAYRRFTNTFEGDYQVRRWLGFNIGYRYTNRNVFLKGLRNLLPGSGTFNPDPTGLDEHENSTNSVIAGAKIKPTKNWSIYADLEKGESDNAFTRLGNNDVFNYRIRSRAAVKDFTFNVSLVSKDNKDIGTTRNVSNLAPFEAIAETKNRYFSANVDWFPHTKFGVSTGYTYNHVNANADVIVPAGAYLRGISQYFVRDSYFFFDVTARPIKRLSIFASYRIDDDKGQGDRVQTRVQDIITSYPIRYQTPEIRLAVRVTKNIDWNVGYQYYDYRERVYPILFANTTISGGPPAFVPVIPAQNYNAHLPYTSVRIHWGGRNADVK
jgi:hypothetical protein